MKHTLVDDVTVVDFGAHFYPKEVREPDGAGGGENELAGEDRMREPENVLAEMETAGIDQMVFSNTNFMGFDDAEWAAEANDGLYEYVEEFDEFNGLAAIPTEADGEEAAQEFERAIDMGFQGGTTRCAPATGIPEEDAKHTKLTDDRLEPVLEVADQTGAPIFIHVATIPDTKYRFNQIFGRERAQQESIARVIHEEIYDSYPNLNLVWHHLGGNIASMLGRVHLHADPGRWPDQGPMKSYDEFLADLHDRVYIDTAGFFGYTAPIRVALEEFDSSQLLFGTDYPWEPRDGDELGWFADSILESATHEEAKSILGGNALDIMVNTD